MEWMCEYISYYNNIVQLYVFPVKRWDIPTSCYFVYYWLVSIHNLFIWYAERNVCLDGSLLVASWNGRFSSWVYTRMFRSRAISSKIIYEKFLRSSNFRSSTDEIMNWNSKHSKHLSFTKEAIASCSWPIFLFISYLQQYKTRYSFE